MSLRTRAYYLLTAAILFPVAACAPVDLPRSNHAPGRPTAVTQTEEALVNAPGPMPQDLRGRIETAIAQVRRRDLLTTNGFWTVFHGILGLGPREATLLDPETGRRVNALDYICAGGSVRGLYFFPTADGLDVQTGPMFVGQGHQDQFIAEIAQWGLAADQHFRVNGKDYTFMDFVRHTRARAQVTADQELSWTMLVLGQYLGTDITWTNAAGETLHFEDLVRYELDQSVEKGACGGTHRLFGLTWVYHLHLRHGGRLNGVWQAVAEKTARYQQLAHQLQNPDGSFSTDFFHGPGNDADMQRRLNTTGHIFEWLALSLPEAELRASWVEVAANALALMLLQIHNQPMEGGTLYHALHGLRLYHARVFGTDSIGTKQFPIPLPPEHLPPARSGQHISWARPQSSHWT